MMGRETDGPSRVCSVEARCGAREGPGSPGRGLGPRGQVSEKTAQLQAF